MICPQCHGESCIRSRRRGSRDFLLSAVGLRPWRCFDCENRFFAWAVSIPHAYHVHCRHCGNLGVKRISSEYVVGPFAGLCRKLHLPAYRCASCRYKFFSIRPQFRAKEAPEAPERKSAAAD
jgi:DNA-directed RNA polymerase subunit RPC12/RpoP